MALTDLTRISTSGIATGTSLSGAILHGDAHFRGTQVGVNSAIFDSSDDALELNDNVKLKFGNDGDLEIGHINDQNIIEDKGNGALILKTNGSAISLQRNTGATMLSAVPEQDVRLYFNGNQKLNTTNDGVVVTGILTASSFSGPIGNPSGISTFYDLRVINNLTVEGTTSTLDTDLIGVDRVEVGANSNSVVGVAITQSGTADIVNLFDGTTEVLTVKDGGFVGVGTINPGRQLHVLGTTRPLEVGSTNLSNIIKLYNSGTGRATYNGFDIKCSSTTGGKLVFYGGYLDFATSASNGTDGTSRIRILSDGKVGIGSEIPTDKLDIQTGSSDEVTKFKVKTQGQLELTRNHASAPYIKTFMSSGNPAIHLGDSSGDKVVIKVDGVSYFNSGNVSIGKTANSGKPLEVYQAGDAAIRIQNNASGTGNNDGILLEIGNTSKDALIWNYESANMRFGTAGTERVRIDNNGRVGLGITNPGDYFSSYNRVVMGRPNDSGSMTIVSAPTFGGYISFADGTSGNQAYRGLIMYAHGGDYMTFNTDSTEKLRITSGGFVGIGVTNPEDYDSGAKNLVVGSAGQEGITIRSSSPNTGNLQFSDGINRIAGLTFKHDSTASNRYFSFLIDNGSSYVEQLRIQDGKLIFSNDQDSYINGGGNVFRFTTGGSERLRIGSNGEILTAGVTSEPLYPHYVTARKVQVEIKGAIDVGQTRHHGSLAVNCTNSNSSIHLVRSDNTQTDGTHIGVLGWVGYDGSDFHQAAAIEVIKGAGAGSDDQPGHMLFKTNAGTNQATEKLRIASNGSVSIGDNPTVHSDTIFHVEKSSGETNVKFEGNDTMGARLSLHNNNTSASANNQLAFCDAGGQSTSTIIGYNTDQTNNYGELVFATRNTQGTPPEERMRISKDGRVGINQGNPSKATLHVVGGNANPEIVAKFKGSSGTDARTKIGLAAAYSDTANDTEGQAYVGALRGGNGNSSRLFFEVSSGTTLKETARVDESGIIAGGSYRFHNGSRTGNVMPNSHNIGDVSSNSISYFHNAGIYYVYATIPTDNTWYTMMTSFNDSASNFRGVCGDASSKNSFYWYFNPTSPSYGVNPYGEKWHHGSWNTGSVTFRLDGTHPNWNLQIKCTSHYGTNRTAALRAIMEVYY